MAQLELTVNAGQAKLNAKAERARLELSQAMESGEIDNITEALNDLSHALQSSNLLQSMIERPNDGPPASEDGTGN